MKVDHVSGEEAFSLKFVTHIENPGPRSRYLKHGYVNTYLSDIQDVRDVINWLLILEPDTCFLYQNPDQYYIKWMYALCR